MRIVVVHSFYSSAQPSGENTVVGQQVAALRDAGHDVLLVARSTDEVERRTLHSARAAATVATGWGASPASEFDAYRPDVIHLHNTFPNFGTSWLRGWGHRTVVTLHNYRTVCAAGTLFRDGVPCHDCLRSPVLPAVRHSCYRDSRVATLPVALAAGPGGALRRIASSAAALVVLNDHAGQFFSDVLDRRAHVVPNFTPSASLSRTARRGWVFVGRLSSEKGARELVDAWPTGETLDVYGDGPLRSSMESVVDQRGLDVHFKGLTPHPQLLASLGDYEGIVVPSMCSEGLPTVVIEGLARGIPAVVSTRVSFGPTMEAAGAGVSFEVPASPELMRGSLEQLRRLPDTAQAAHALHRDSFSPASWLDRITPIYERVAAGVSG